MCWKRQMYGTQSHNSIIEMQKEANHALSVLGYIAKACGRQVYNNPYYLFKNFWCFNNETIEMKPWICMSAAGDYNRYFSFYFSHSFLPSFLSIFSSYNVCNLVHYSLSIFHCLQSGKHEIGSEHLWRQATTKTTRQWQEMYVCKTREMEIITENL